MSKSGLTRRGWLSNTTILGAMTALSSRKFRSVRAGESVSSDIVDIGSRRELFVDHFLIDRLDGTHLKLHEPRPAAPLQSSVGEMQYGTVIKDSRLFRLYTRDARGAKFDGDEPEVTRYYESLDGIHWITPSLQLVELEGSRDNNVILHEPSVCHNFSPFLDSRPDVSAEQRFKALAGVHRGGGLVAFTSADGIRWKRLREGPVITSDDFAFDSQNVSFWSEVEQQYVCFFRSWNTPHGRLRTISRTTSPDYQHWTPPVALHPNFPGEHLYTSQTHPYFRAPHIYIATPTRFHPQLGSSTDIMFMTARANKPYDRTFREAFIRPGPDPKRWGNRSNYAALNVVPTGNSEMSLYVTPFRRLTLRTDGFASLHAGADTGEMVTHRLRFLGKSLVVNYATSAGGSLRVELQDASGRPLPGFTLADCQSLVGDIVEQPVSWTGGSDVSEVADKPVRLRFVMQEADVFALKFS